MGLDNDSRYDGNTSHEDESGHDISRNDGDVIADDGNARHDDDGKNDNNGRNDGDIIPTDDKNDRYHSVKSKICLVIYYWCWKHTAIYSTSKNNAVQQCKTKQK